MQARTDLKKFEQLVEKLDKARARQVRALEEALAAAEESKRLLGEIKAAVQLPGMIETLKGPMGIYARGIIKRLKLGAVE